jgi:SAM-dependent methyltransferase
MTPDTDAVRTTSFGEGYAPTLVDRFGVWLSLRKIRRFVGTCEGLQVGDFGCGYNATAVRSMLGDIAHAHLVDVSIADDLRADPKVTAIEGGLPEVLPSIPSDALDVVMCMSVLEHLWEPLDALREFHRIARPGATVLLNVPSWRGKRFLELSAFRLGLSPADEMDDHKAYYDPRDLWPLLVRAGFRPSGIRCFKHKFGLNTFAACTVAN